MSTLTARDLWYDDTVRRLNADKRGQYLGAFEGDDRIMQIFSNGEFKVTGYDLSTHFDDDMVAPPIINLGLCSRANCSISS